MKSFSLKPCSCAAKPADLVPPILPRADLELNPKLARWSGSAMHFLSIDKDQKG